MAPGVRAIRHFSSSLMLQQKRLQFIHGKPFQNSSRAHSKGGPSLKYWTMLGSNTLAYMCRSEDKKFYKKDKRG